MRAERGRFITQYRTCAARVRLMPTVVYLVLDNGVLTFSESMGDPDEIISMFSSKFGMKVSRLRTAATPVLCQCVVARGAAPPPATAPRPSAFANGSQLVFRSVAVRC